MRLKTFWNWKEPRKSLVSIHRAFGFKKTQASDVEAFKCSRYPDGTNPAVIRHCSKIPAAFARTERLVAPSLENCSRLQEDQRSLKIQEEGSVRRSQPSGPESSDSPMTSYQVRVATGPYWGSGTFDSISITLVGSKGESPKQPLNNLGKDFVPGAVDEYEVSSDRDLGQLWLVRLHKEPYLFFPADSWYCTFIQLTTPRGETYQFPCYQWIEGYRTMELREGTGKLASVDAGNPFLLQHRAEELKARQQSYRWAEFVPGMPHCLAVENIEEMDTNVKFSLTKLSTFIMRSKLTKMEMKLKGFMSCHDSWKQLEDIRKIFWFNKTPVSEHVADHWLEDSFFGYQYLNGVNPVVIQKCTQIPANFPVTHDMVAKSLGESTTLQEEVQKGNIFIVDYKILEGIPGNTIHGRKQYLTAPFCLLYQTPSGDLVPIAIQLSQTPGPDHPIFVPSDHKWDWTLAKMWVRNADFHIHQNLSHLLRTHLMAEVFAMATLRQLPMCHPLFKLLIPHLRYTFQINALARVRLIHKGGMMDQATSAGYEGIVPIVGRGFQALTYASLCLPDDLEARGVASIRNYYYRDDAMKIWAAIESYVSGIVQFYYKTDERVQRDSELQSWILEIFREAFRKRKTSGAPSSLETLAELTKFLTMVIFTCSVQHAAVNSGQYDYGAWIPNIPPTMRRPPPKVKGLATLESILETLPPVSITCIALSSLWLLSNEAGDRRPLGYFPDEYFTEQEPKQLIAAFQDRLAEISEKIDERNMFLPLPYNYVNPPNVENSISI